MVQRNYVIAIIVIVLFVILALVGYAIYAVQNRVKGERAGRGGSRIKHRRQRTGVKLDTVKSMVASFESSQPNAEEQPQIRAPLQGVVQTRVASFENLHGSTTNINDQPTRSATASADLPPRRQPATLEPPILFSPQAASKRRWENPSLRQMAQMRVPSFVQQDDDLDLEIRNDELLTMKSRPLPKPRAQRPTHKHSTTLAASVNTISRAASIMYEPEDRVLHTRSKSVPKTPTTAIDSRSRSRSSTRLVPASSHATMFPSAFRIVATETDERPSSSCSNASTISSPGPATPKSPTLTAGSSWLSWLTSPVTSPVTEKPPSRAEHALTKLGRALSPLASDADDFGFVVQKGVGDHWADLRDADHHDENLAPSTAKARTVSRQVQWQDEESVRFRWF
ncbi:hypothetical protein LTR05_006927 [Lithohypha guttulata]|uniref:Uncharacterized protein n=1 Tax=Lithohypha guttulata TaxID=1690604 RepID=A0AAN7SWR8_9EURO|nr:hypothetical protein LTR05_006927 [Lithohypha guttulata]